ncbi:MAG: flagellar protein [Devosia sp.]|uniref:flagellin N-terminal helical domain-containing protein n=1 Tax=Devosia sp. TaxID=1871048 RepID=UPI0026065CF8|nr:flagellin [Devosia sp.]MDB5527811.1 flagellar protein [Devosia sp.]
MANINLTAAVRSNLSALQGTATLMNKTQDRLSTGNKVNSALDNPTNFFTAASLNSRSNDLNNLMDSMANGVKTIEAANNGLTSITKNLESMQSTLRQARQDKSFATASYTLASPPPTALVGSAITLTGGSLGTASVLTSKAVSTSSVVAGTVLLADNGKQFKVGDGTNTTADITLATGDTQQMIADKINSATDTASVKVTASVDATGKLVVTKMDSTATAVTAAALTEGTVTGGMAASFGTAVQTFATKTADEMVNTINDTVSLQGKVRASNDNGKLRIENDSTQALTVAGTTFMSGSASIAGNTVRSDLATQFNQLRDQLDKLSDDASFNGINLLRGDKLKITFNETGTSSIDISTKGQKAVNSSNLKVTTTLAAKDLDSDDNIDKYIAQIGTALTSVRSQASSFGSNLSIVQNRQDFTKSMTNTLETGAGNLTLADMNLEAANMLALQTRQSLAQSTLSMANQADQGVLQLLR